MVLWGGLCWGYFLAFPDSGALRFLPWQIPKKMSTHLVSTAKQRTGKSWRKAFYCWLEAFFCFFWALSFVAGSLLSFIGWKHRLTGKLENSTIGKLEDWKKAGTFSMPSSQGSSIGWPLGDGQVTPQQSMKRNACRHIASYLTLLINLSAAPQSARLLLEANHTLKGSQWET